MGDATRADFSRTVSGVASSLYLVNPGAPSDRERMVLASSMPESSVCTYKDASITGEAPKWCPFNDPHLHEHIFRRLEKSGLVDRSKFVTVPVKGAGELTGFRYSGGTTPQHLIFPIGSSEINWLTVLRGATRLGMVAASAKDAGQQVPDLVAVCNTKAAMKRLRVWRALNWIFEASRTAGMIRYEPFSVGCALYQHEADRMQLKGRYERVALYLGDHFCKESVLLSDISRGGRASDFWTVVEAVVLYKRNHHVALTEDETTPPGDGDWTEILGRNRQRTEQGGEGPEKTLEAAIAEMQGMGEARKSHLLHFVSSCLTAEQRDVLFKGLGLVNPAALTSLADSVLANTAKRGVWIMMHSLLKQIQFNILHLVGPKAHRILIMKIFMPALVALFLAQGGVGDSFVHGALTLEVMKKRVANSTLAGMLSRDTWTQAGDAAAAPARHYSEYDMATLHGQLTDCAPIPLAFNVGIPLHRAVMDMRHVDLVVEHTINTSLARQRIAANNRAAMRLKYRRKAQEQATHLKRQQAAAEEEEPSSEEASSSEGESARKKRKRPLPNTPVPLKRGKFRENIAGLVIATIQNEDRQVNVESIQKLLTARHTKNHHLTCSDSGVATAATASGRTSNIYSTDEMAEAFIKYVMNFFDKVFGLRTGSMLNSIHSNRRTEEGVYNAAQQQQQQPYCECPDTSKHSDSCLRERDALSAESTLKTCSVDICDPKQVAARFLEFIMDPPSLTAVDNAMTIERVLQNEQMLSSMLNNPVFTSVLGAEKGDLGRYVVLSNIVKFVNVLIACLVDGDLPLLAETRKQAKTSLERGKTRKPGNGFDYREAGHCPTSGLRDVVLPDCISALKSIAMEKGRGGRAVLRRQNCDHAFCRMLKFFFFSVDPTKSAESFTDPASRATLFKLDDICRDRKKYAKFHWYRDLLLPVKKGEENWVQSGEYTSLGADDASPVDFYRSLKMSMLDEGVIVVPKPGNEHNISSISSAADLLRESIDSSCEAYRPLLFDRTTILAPGQLTADNQELDETQVEEAPPAVPLVTGLEDEFDPILYLISNLQPPSALDTPQDFENGGNDDIEQTLLDILGTSD